MVVEILLSFLLKRDREDKRELYARYGMEERWIVDPANRVVSAMLLRDGVLELAGT